MLTKKLLISYLTFWIIFTIGPGIGTAATFLSNHMLKSEKQIKNVDILDWLHRLINPEITWNFPNENGWQNLSWGMTIAEVKRNLPLAQEAPPNRGNIPAKHSERNFFGAEKGTKLYLSDYDLDGQPATAIFDFDASDKLEKVRVHSDTWRTQTYADGIFLALTTKYGNPAKDHQDDNQFNKTRKAEWLNKNTVITFSTLEVGHDGEVGVSVIYRRGPMGALNKI